MTQEKIDLAFCYKYEVNYSLQNAGINRFPNGDRVWQLILECENAITINLLQEIISFRMELFYLYDIDKTNRVGDTPKETIALMESWNRAVHGEDITEYVESCCRTRKIYNNQRHSWIQKLGPPFRKTLQSIEFFR